MTARPPLEVSAPALTPPLDARYSPAAERNSAPILAELQRLLPATGTLLEVASGTGQHAAFCSAGLPLWQWWPSDHEAEALPSIAAWCAAGLAAGLSVSSRVQAPLLLDVLQPHWPGVPPVVDAVFCANLIHIAPWACCTGLMQGAARHLSAQGLLITYGPYLEDDVPTSPGNTSFDADLKARNPAWGLRRRKAVEVVAAGAGLQLLQRVAMPANNLLLAWGRSAQP